jgi:hypothetical protein
MKIETKDNFGNLIEFYENDYSVGELSIALVVNGERRVLPISVFKKIIYAFDYQ